MRGNVDIEHGCDLEQLGGEEGQLRSVFLGRGQVVS